MQMILLVPHALCFQTHRQTLLEQLTALHECAPLFRDAISARQCTLLGGPPTCLLVQAGRSACHTGCSGHMWLHVANETARIVLQDGTSVHAWLRNDTAALDRHHTCKRRSVPLLGPMPAAVGDLLPTPLFKMHNNHLVQKQYGAGAPGSRPQVQRGGGGHSCAHAANQGRHSGDLALEQLWERCER